MAKTTKKAGGQDVEFVCRAPSATAVFLAGSFNGWSPDATPMEAEAAGEWKATVALPKGRHEFKFVIDGEWCCGPDCPGPGSCSRCVPDGHGGMNRLLEVG
ncbi:MAG: glycoside hydrolase family 13 [Akkermansiaceae bacterium]|nr:glycoside hydrolase family 13 [Akkermansiaceae bacterium]